MTKIALAPSIKSTCPDFKIGYAIYHNIVVEKSPQMVRGRFQFYQETMMMDLEQTDLITFPSYPNGVLCLKNLVSILPISSLFRIPLTTIKERELASAQFIQLQTLITFFHFNIKFRLAFTIWIK